MTGFAVALLTPNAERFGGLSGSPHSSQLVGPAQAALFRPGVIRLTDTEERSERLSLKRTLRELRAEVVASFEHVPLARAAIASIRSSGDPREKLSAR